MNKPLTSTRLKRLRFRALHRGNKEMDIVFSRFLEKGLERFDDKTLDLFEALLEEDDVDLWQWLTGGDGPARYQSLLAMMADAD